MATRVGGNAGLRLEARQVICKRRRKKSGIEDYRNLKMKGSSTSELTGCPLSLPGAKRMFLAALSAASSKYPTGDALTTSQLQGWPEESTTRRTLAEP